MSIPLPPLPVADPELVKRFGPPTYTLDQLRARDLQVARVVLEAAAKVCDHWSKQNHVYVNGALRCGEGIRALEFTHDRAALGDKRHNARGNAPDTARTD